MAFKNAFLILNRIFTLQIGVLGWKTQSRNKQQATNAHFWDKCFYFSYENHNFQTKIKTKNITLFRALTLQNRF